MINENRSRRTLYTQRVINSDQPFLHTMLFSRMLTCHTITYVPDDVTRYKRRDDARHRCKHYAFEYTHASTYFGRVTIFK